MPSKPPDGVIKPLTSEFASDPEMAELVTLFLSELPQRISTLADSWRDKKFKEVQRLAHQLKGASAGYGFPTIGLAAGKVENRLRDADPGDAPERLAALNTDLNELVNLCQRALRAQPTP